MGRDKCRMPSCENEPETSRGFCSEYCECKYDHLKAEAKDARLADMEPEPAVEERDLPERDGPPY